MNKLLLVILYFFSFIVISKAQNNIPELEKSLKTDTGKDKFETLYNLSKAYLSVSPKKSLSYGNEAYDIAKRLRDKSMQANALNMIGTAYYKQNKYKYAIKYYEKELAIRDELGQKFSKAKILYNIGSVYEVNNKKKKAYTNYKLALKESKLLKYQNLSYKCYESLIKLFVNQRDYKEAFLYLQEYQEVKGSIDISRKQHKIDILETRFQEEKKEKEEKELQLNLIDSTLNIIKSEKETLVKDTIEKNLEISDLTTETIEQKNTIQEQKAEVDRQRQWLFAFGAFFTIILIFSILLYKSYTAKKKAHNLLVIQSEEIKVQSEQLLQKNIKIKKQKAELEAQSEEIEKHWDIALKSKTEIIDSINYAERIQKAILPSEKYMNEVLGEYFVLLIPKDIVSGDFYWIKKIKDFIIIAVADCTGHGVPGAFMSMLGISLLNENLGSGNINNAGEILNLLRNKIKSSLGQKGKFNEPKDGMDIALCIINIETLELQYSGAYNPLYIIRENPEVELKILKADRQPIAFHRKEKNFTNHNFQLRKGDCLYLFSDGYSDQFGGEKGDKFRSENFREILLNIYKNPMSKQKVILDKTIATWMGQNYKQVDDVIVFGMRI
ncbi:MAG: SpoIIE family protein phosphatase [Bacteroidota bacterium]